MAAEVIVPHRFEVHQPPEVDEVEQVGAHRGKNGDAAIDHVIPIFPDEQKHPHQCNEFEQHRTQGDVAVLLHGFVQPFCSNAVEQDHGAHDHVQSLFLPQLGHRLDGDEEGQIGQHTGDQVDEEDLLGHPGQLLPVIPHLGAGPDAVGGDAQLGKHGEVGDHRIGKGHGPDPLGS